MSVLQTASPDIQSEKKKKQLPKKTQQMAAKHMKTEASPVEVPTRT